MEAPLPKGYRFYPTDQELIDYLYDKVNDRPLPCNAIIDCDIYGGDSSWRKMFDDREEESLYFFTKLRNRGTQKNGSSSRAMRATKFGTWRAQSDMEIYAGKIHIGSKRTFTLIEKKKEEEEPKKRGSKKTKGWTMHEYRLDGCFVQQNEPVYVVSRISRPRSMRRDGGETCSQLVSDLGAMSSKIECVLDDISKIECVLDDISKIECVQDDIKMLPGDSFELDYVDDCFSSILGQEYQEDFSYLWDLF